jgi:hypothetical protein
MKRRTKIILIAGGILLITATALVFYFDSIIEDLIENEAKKWSEKQSDMMEVRIGSIKSTFILQKVTFSDVEILWKRSNHPSIENLQLGIEKLVIKLPGFRNILRGDSLHIRKVDIRDPSGFVLLRDSTELDSSKSKPGAEPGAIQHLLVKSISVSDGEIDVRKLDSLGKVNDIVELKGIQLDLGEGFIQLKETAAKNKFRYDRYSVGVENVTFYGLKDLLLTLEDFELASNSRSFTISKAFMQSPQNENATVSSRLNYSLKTEDICVTTAFSSLDEGIKHLEKIRIGKSSFMGSFPMNTDTAGIDFEHLPKLLRESNFMLDTLFWSPIEMDITFVDSMNRHKDQIHFSDLLIQGITRTNFLEKDSSNIQLLASGNMFDNAQLFTNISLAMDSTSSELSGNLSLKNVDYLTIKPFLEKRIDIGFNQGELKRFEVDFSVDSSRFFSSISLDIEKVHIDENNWFLPPDYRDFQAKFDRFQLQGTVERSKNNPGTLMVDSLQIDQPIITWNTQEIKNEPIDPILPKRKNRDVLFRTYVIRNLLINNLSILNTASSGGVPRIKVSRTDIHLRGLTWSDDEPSFPQKRPQLLVVRGNDFVLNTKKVGAFNVSSYAIDSRTKRIDLNGVRYRSNGSKYAYLNKSNKDAYWLGAYIETIGLDLDFKKAYTREFHIRKLDILNPILTFINDPDDVFPKKERKEKSIPSIRLDRIHINNGDIKYAIRTASQNEFKILAIKEFNGRISNFITAHSQGKPAEPTNIDLIGKLDESTRIHVQLDMDDPLSVSRLNGSFSLSNLSLKTWNHRLYPFFNTHLNNGSVDDLSLSFKVSSEKLEGSMRISNFQSERIELSQKSIQKKDFVKVIVPECTLSFNKFLGKGEHPILLTDIILNKPILTYFDFVQKEAQRAPLSNKLWYEGNTKPFLQASHIKLINAQLGIQYASETEPHTRAGKTNIEAWELHVFNDSARQSILPLTLGDLDLEMARITRVDLKTHTMNLSNLNYRLKDQKLLLEHLRIKNRLSLVDLYRNQLYRKPWFDLYVPSIAFTFNLEEIIHPNPRIQQVDISSADFLFQFDYKLDIDPTIKPMFYDMIRSPKIDYTIDEVNIKDSNVKIYMQENTPNRSGYLIFNDIHGKISNISSDPTQIKQNPVTTVGVKTKLWGAGEAVLSSKIRLDDPKKSFTLSGDVGALDMTVADTLIADLFNMTIKSGQLNGAHFDVSFDDQQARGHVNFDYEQLKVGLYKGQHQVTTNNDPMSTDNVAKEEKLNAGFVSGIIVNGLIREKNLPSKGSYKVGPVLFNREPDKPVFRYIWYSMSTGLLEIVESGMVKTIRNFGKPKSESEEKK